MKETQWFYKTKKWQEVRDQAWRRSGGLCENCMAKGIVKAGEIVHHIEHITPKNIHNPEITLNLSNLKVLCRECHGEEHRKSSTRYKIKKDGSIEMK